jgi:hypothetical protein
MWSGGERDLAWVNKNIAVPFLFNRYIGSVLEDSSDCCTIM